MLLLVGGAPGAQVGSPALAIVSPREGAFVAGRTPLRARVEPAGEASSVIFYVDGLQVCALSKPPFECDWDAGVEVVEHQIRAVATLTGARHLVSNVRTKGFDYTESVDVRSVQLTATVSDNRGHFVKGLPKSSFRVFEDDRLQTISHFEAENVALDLIVALDISGSMGPSMPALKQAAREFLTAIPTTNKVTLLAFNDTSFTLARGATNPADRIRAVDGLVPWGGTALYDVLARGVDMFGAGTGRKALIVFTDGEDYGSGASLEDAEARLQESDVTLYMIGQGKGVTLEPLKRVMHRLADPTGGLPLFVERTDQLRGVFRELLEELSNQYSGVLRADQYAARWHDATYSRRGSGAVPRTRAKRLSRTSRGKAMTYRLLCSVALAVAVGSVAGAVRVRGQQPAFKTEAEALAVDVSVLDGSGTPVPGLGASDFDVRVDGRQRRVINVQWISGTAACARAGLPASDNSRRIRVQSVAGASVRPSDRHCR